MLNVSIESEGGNGFSDTKHIDQLLITFDRWESRAAGVLLGEAMLLFQGTGRQGGREIYMKSIEQFAETHQCNFPEISYVDDTLD